MANKITAWSYSRLSTWETCPLQAKLKFIDRLKEPDSPAMQRGHKMHEDISKYLQGKAEGLPREAFQHPRIESMFGELAQFGKDLIVEQQWGFNANWQPTGWFGADTWFRSILDVGVIYDDMTGCALDWKTGRRYGSNMDQMKSQAVAMFEKYKPLKEVEVRLAYIDTAAGDDPFEIADIKRHETASIKADFEKRVGRMMNDQIFAPRPNDKCRFCAFGKDKGGQCAFG